MSSCCNGKCGCGSNCGCGSGCKGCGRSCDESLMLLTEMPAISPASRTLFRSPFISCESSMESSGTRCSSYIFM
ncbi:hypothetical protein KP509_05G084700 [Ceratopteris richardii]|uniref:Metallothionein n=1 Tax=Ceratopteris richardii TaxID=49495 RepID=A0A8T2UNG5_CERRI|nr:hypothetical protein KP509_05G084700 [Ceratopteris richardii]